MTGTFSERHGYRPPDTEIMVRDDAPIEVRHAILALGRNHNLTPKMLREEVCSVLLKIPNPYNWSDYPNVWQEVTDLIESCDWFEVYNIAERLYSSFPDGNLAERFASDLNQFFLRSGIGWEMRGGLLMFRGSQVFERATKDAASILSSTGRPRASSQIQEALLALSRRPEPDVTGAIHHAMGALEATARDVTGQPNPTLGQLIPKLGLPKPLDAAVEKLWAYSTDRARHIREGQSVDTEEAELIVTVSAAICTFITKRNSIQ